MTPSTKKLAVALGLALLAIAVTATWLVGRLVTLNEVRDQAHRLMETVSVQAIGRVLDHLAPTGSIGELQLALGSGGLAEPGAEAELERFLFERLRRSPGLSGLHYASRRGDFLYVTREVPGGAAPFLTKHISAGPGARSVELVLRDEAFGEFGRRADPEDRFDPRSRPWYGAIAGTDRVVWTEPYRFHTSGRPGVSVAAPVPGRDGVSGGVVTMDLEIGRIRELLDDIRVAPGGFAFIIDGGGRLLADPAGRTLRPPGERFEPALALRAVAALEDGLDMLPTGSARFVRFESDGRAMLASFARFPATPVPWIVGSYVPEAGFERPVDRVELLLIGAVGLVTLLACSGALWLGLGVARSLHRMDDALRQRANDELFRELFEAFPTPVTLTGIEDRKVLFANRRAREIFRFTGDLAGASAADFYANPADVGQLRERLQREGFADQVEVQMRRADGSLFWALLSARVFVYGGRPLLLTGINDISDRKDIEARLREAGKMEAVGRLAGGIAHDFNSMIGTVLGYATFLVEDLPPRSEAREFASRIRTVCERARDVVRQLLTFSRPGEAVRETVDLAAALRDNAALIRAGLAPGTRLSLVLADGPLPVMANLSQLYQVLLNLCANANDALDGREGIVTLRLDRVDAGHPDRQAVAEPVAAETGTAGFGALRPDLDYAAIRISDTGAGIAPEALGRIFEPFFTTKPTGRGTGLGLAVVHGIVAAAHGAYRVQSAPGRGTSVTIWLPLVAEAAPVA